MNKEHHPPPFPTAEREFQRTKEMPWSKVEQASQDAAHALDGPEAERLRAAETQGKARLKEEDPELYQEAEGIDNDERRELYQRAAERVARGSTWRDAIRAELSDRQP
jgi:hypothetical protein